MQEEDEVYRCEIIRVEDGCPIMVAEDLELDEHWKSAGAPVQPGDPGSTGPSPQNQATSSGVQESARLMSSGVARLGFARPGQQLYQSWWDKWRAR